MWLFLSIIFESRKMGEKKKGEGEGEGDKN
jgi:hypothetical protein